MHVTKDIMRITIMYVRNVVLDAMNVPALAIVANVMIPDPGILAKIYVNVRTNITKSICTNAPNVPPNVRHVPVILTNAIPVEITELDQVVLVLPVILIQDKRLVKPVHMNVIPALFWPPIVSHVVPIDQELHFVIVTADGINHPMLRHVPSAQINVTVVLGLMMIVLHVTRIEKMHPNAHARMAIGMTDLPIVHLVPPNVKHVPPMDPNVLHVAPIVFSQPTMPTIPINANVSMVIMMTESAKIANNVTINVLSVTMEQPVPNVNLSDQEKLVIVSRDIMIMEPPVLDVKPNVSSVQEAPRTVPSVLKTEP